MWDENQEILDELTITEPTVKSHSEETGVLAIGQMLLNLRKPKISNEVFERLRTLILVDSLDMLLITNLVNLKSLAILDCSLESLPQLSNLTLLTLAKTNLKELPSELQKLSMSLEVLCVRNNKLRQLPSWLKDFKMLRILNVDDNYLKELPRNMGYLVNLNVLTVCNNKIRKLPLSLGLLTECLRTFHWSGNPLKLPFPSTAETSSTLVLDYLKSLMEKTVPNTLVKLTFVGQEGAGKSTLVKAIGFKSDWRLWSVSSPDKTDGVEISSIELQDYTLKVFDLAGDVEYLRTHMLFLSENNLFLAVFDMSQYVVGNICRTSDQLGRLELWLETIQSHNPGSHCIITGTHADHPMLSEEMKQIVRQQICQLVAKYQSHHLLFYENDYFDTCLVCNSSLLSKTKLGRSQKHTEHGQEQRTSTYCIPHVVGYQEVGSKEQYPRSLTTSKNPSVRELKECLTNNIEVLLRQKSYTEISQKWAMARDSLQQILQSDLEMQREPVVSLQRIQKLAKDLKIDAATAMIKFFHSQGDLLWYDNIPELQESVIIEPKWLSVVLRKAVSFRPEVDFINDGILNHKHFTTIWQDISNGTRGGLLPLFRRAGLCFQLSDTEEMFPCCLPVGWPDNDIWPSVPSESELQLTYDFVFSFLPPSFFSDLTVEIHKRKRLSYPSNIKPVYYRFHVVFLTKTCGLCSHHEEAKASDVQSESSFSTFPEVHRVYLEVIPHNNTLKVIVRSAQPCCVMCEIQDIVSEVNHTRYKGISYTEYIVCPQCELNRVKNSARFELNSVKEPVCSRGHVLGSARDILTGKAGKPANSTAPELKRLGRIVGETLEDHYCPKLFVVLPIQTDSLSLKERFVYTYLRDGFAVHLLCECPGQWHFVDSPGFRLSRPNEFFEVHGSRICKILKVISALQGGMNAAARLDPHFKIGAGIAAQAGSLAKDLDSLLENYLDKYPELKSSCSESVESDMKYLKTATKLQRSELARFLGVATQGRQFGPLVCTYLEKSCEWLWLCQEHNLQFEIVER